MQHRPYLLMMFQHQMTVISRQAADERDVTVVYVHQMEQQQLEVIIWYTDAGSGGTIDDMTIR